MLDFTGKKAFVTGAASGMGKACAVTFAKAGADVALADLNVEAAQKTAEEISSMGVKAVAYRLDVSDEEQVEQIGNTAWEEFNGFDAVIHAAGIVKIGELRELPVSAFDKIIGVNLRGTYLINNKFSKFMLEKREGSIVNFSSIAGKIGEATNVPYSASKGGVSLLTQSLALEMAPFNVRVNAVAPGKILTELSLGAAKTSAEQLGCTVEEFIHGVEETIPMGRYGTPEDVADVVLFLASDMARYITGQTITVAGGFTLI